MPMQDDATPRPREPARLDPGSLPPGHRCRVDDLAYTSVGSWWADHRGRVPIQAAAGLDRYGGPIILIEPG